MTDEDPFGEITSPDRTFDSGGHLSYEGGTVLVLRPNSTRSDSELRSLVRAVLESGPYRHGDFLDLPMPVWLVRDEQTGDVFRVTVRDGSIELHVLPQTKPVGLRAWANRIADRTETGWTVSATRRQESE